jgi:hypothetical protein
MFQDEAGDVGRVQRAGDAHGIGRRLVVAEFDEGLPFRPKESRRPEVILEVRSVDGVEQIREIVERPMAGFVGPPLASTPAAAT